METPRDPAPDDATGWLVVAATLTFAALVVVNLDCQPRPPIPIIRPAPVVRPVDPTPAPAPRPYPRPRPCPGPAPCPNVLPSPQSPQPPAPPENRRG